MSKQAITTINSTGDYLTLYFNQDWFQEDIAELTELVFFNLMPLKIQEKIVGADRENIRFAWRDHYFTLNFDCCSQSCWLEGQDVGSTAQLTTLYSVLIQ